MAMKTDKDKDIINLKAGLAAQGYLLETLLLNLVHSQPNPASLIQTIRFQLEAQLRSDMARIGQVFPGIAATQELGDATMHCLHASLDRIAGQFENPAPEKYKA